MGCDASNEVPTRQQRKKYIKKSALPPDTEDKFLPTKHYCPSTELTKGNTLARGQEDDDYALLKRRVDPKKSNYFHFMVWATEHRDFAVGVAQIEAVSRAAVSYSDASDVSDESDLSDSDNMGG